MMKRSLRLSALILTVCLLFTGCSISLDSLGLGKLKNLFSDEDIVCVITAKNDKLLTVEVLSPDSHYDPGDSLYVQYTAITGATSLNVGDYVTFTYDYITGVSEKLGDPYILADTISPTEYIPTEPPTEEPTEPPAEEPTEESTEEATETEETQEPTE